MSTGDAARHEGTLRSTIYQTNLDADATNAPSSRAVGPTAAERQIVVKEHGQQILAARDQLPSDEGQAIVTAYDGRCSYCEAAITLGQSARTVKLRFRSELRRLTALNDALSLSQTSTVADLS